MKKYLDFVIIGFAAMASITVSAQHTAPAAIRPMNKKWVYGAHFQIAWNGITGPQLPGQYFYKPGVAGSFLTEYYPYSWLGIGAGLGYTARGPGRITEDLDKSLGNADSTHRFHYFFRTVDLPLYMTLRSPVFNRERCRLSSRIGAGFSGNFKSTSVFHSIEDGFHENTDVKRDFYRSDLFTHVSGGLDINSGDQTLFQIHLYWQRGHRNIFSEKGDFGSSTGYNQSYGFQLSVFY
jgi:hypothetical protein